MSALPIHIDLEGFESSAGQLLIGGKPVSDIYAESGRPVYVYDEKIIHRTIATLSAALPPRVVLHYAIKANPMPEVVRCLAALVGGLDVASAWELEIALDTGVDAKDISFAGPGKTLEELDRAVRSGIVLNVESAREISRICAISQEQNVIANVAVRVNPDFELKGSGMRMGGGAKQFGIDAEVVPDLLKDLHSKPLKFEGLHLFCGSQNLSADAICEAQEKSLTLALELCRDAPNPPRFINIGGGFGIPYFPGDKKLELSRIGQNMAALVTELEHTYPECELIVELGRFLVGEAGVYLCEVLDVKESRGHRFIITNGGLHHHLSASGNFGQIIRKNYPVAVATKLDSSAKLVKSTVVGPLCTPLDVLATNLELPGDVEVGDIVAVFQSGAYGYTASPHLFLGHPPPNELFIPIKLEKE